MQRLLKIFLFLACLSVSTPMAHAALSLSANPFDGGNSLRLGRVDSKTTVNKEVRIRINSSEGKQYQVFQRIVNPFQNEKGTALRSDAVKTYTVVGSNSYGTLYGNDLGSIGYSEELLYTSNPNGDGDSFTVIYSLSGNDLNASGNFLGQMMYTVRTIGGGAQQDMFLNAEIEAGGELSVDIKGSSGQDRVKLSSARERDAQGYVKISFHGNVGAVKVYQQMDEFLKDELNDFLNNRTIQLTTSGSPKGESRFSSPAVLERKKVLLYSSSEPEDTLVVSYLLDQDQLAVQKAGRFTGKLNFSLETDQFSRSFPIDMEVEVSPVFKLDVEYPPEGVRFSKLLPNSPPQMKEVIVKVKSNLGKPYIVTQHVGDALTSQKGTKLSQNYFTLKEELLADSTGKIKFSEFAPVPLGENPIFYSDAQGSSSQFKAIYRLSPYPEIEAGEYTMPIVYSLEQM